MIAKRKAYEEKLVAQLEEWNAQLNLLKAKGNKVKAEAKIEYYKIIESMQHKQNEARTKLQELRDVGDEKWEDLKTNLENAWTKIKTDFQKASKLK